MVPLDEHRKRRCPRVGFLSAEYKAACVSPSRTTPGITLNGGRAAWRVGMFQSTQLGSPYHAMLLSGNGSSVFDSSNIAPLPILPTSLVQGACEYDL